MREERQPWRPGGGRISLDVPMRSNPVSHLHQQYSHHHLHHHSSSMEKQIMKEKKYKQPSSPGGRLASFLNSLFNQTGSKKKKSKSTTQSMKDEEESPGGRRKRRSSISHFRSSSTTDTKSMYSSSSASGFRTPPAYAHTPTKSYKDLRTLSSDHKQIISLPKNAKSTQNDEASADHDQIKINTDFSWLDEKLKLIDAYTEKQKNVGKNQDRMWEEKEFRKLNEMMDDGGESDSSSDLFELQNYDLGIYSTGLPVYETTHMDTAVKRPISNAAL